MRVSVIVIVGLGATALASASASLTSTAYAAAAGNESAPPEAAPVAPKTQQSAEMGAFLPLTQAASSERQVASVWANGGYDSARSAALFETAGEVRVWGPISVRGGAVYTPAQNGAQQRLRPSFGAKAQLLRESAHGVDGSVGVFYRPEGLTEPEGEIESLVSVGRHVGRTYLIGNLLYGQDPEGNERDGEVRLAALRPVASRVTLGIDGRLRFDLGSDKAKLAAHGEPTLDVLVGPVASVVVGPVALQAQAGASSLRVAGQDASGVFVMGGAGAAF